MATPPLPPGFVLVDDEQAQAAPPLPPGFVEDAGPAPFTPRRWDLAAIQAEAGRMRDAGTATPGPASDSGFQNFVEGYGKSYVDTGRGIRQLYRSFLDTVDPIERTTADLITGRDPSRAAEDERAIAEARRLDAPLMQTAGGQVGNIAGQAVQIATPLPGGAAGAVLGRAGRAAPYIASAARAGTFGGLQGVTEDESRLQRAATDAALGAVGEGVAQGAGIVAKKAAARVAPAVRQAIDTARKAGIPLNVAQVTDSPVIKTAQAVTKYLPFSGAQKSARATQEGFNRAVGESFGAQNATSITDDVLRDARTRIGDGYNDIWSRNSVSIDPNTLRALARIESEALRDLTEADAKVVSNQVEKVLDDFAAGPMVTGPKFQSLRASLKGAEDGGRIGRYVKQIRGELEAAADNSIGPQDAAALRELNGQYANLRVAENALKQVGASSGDIRPGALKALIRKGSTARMKELATLGDTVLRNVTPDSGTAQRQFYTNLLTGGGAASAGLATGTLPLLAKGIATGAIAGRALNSNIASRALATGAPSAAAARVAKVAPRVLPPLVGNITRQPIEVDVVGGSPVSREELERELSRRKR